MADKPGARTPGAKRAGPGEHLFEMAKIDPIMGGRTIRPHSVPASRATG